MKKQTSFLKLLGESIIALLLLVILTISMQSLTPKAITQAVKIESSVTQPQPYPFSQTTASPEPNALPDFPQLSSPYPPPENTATIFTSGKVRELLDVVNLPENTKVAILNQGNLWIVSSEKQSEKAPGIDDIAVIYGWNYDGTKLLLGRGLYETGPEMAKATELWVYEVAMGKVFRLVDSQSILAASWSPIDDRIAYSEYGDPPVIAIVSLDGVIQQKRKNLYPGIAWSPDGSAIAVRYSDPEMNTLDTIYPVVCIWWLEKDELSVANNIKRENHSAPIWTMDGEYLVFHRTFDPNSDQGQNGLYILNIKTMEMNLYPNSPKLYAAGLMRSPRSDAFLYRSGVEIYVLEYGKQPFLIGKGSKPIWLTDGKTIIYYSETEQIQSSTLNFVVKDQIIGGYLSNNVIHLQPDIFFAKEDVK